MTSIIVGGRVLTVAEFESAHGLHVGGRLYLSGTGITSIGKDSRDYEFFAVRLASGPRVIAGCRNFSPAEARAHWREGSECRALAEKCIAALEAESAP